MSKGTVISFCDVTGIMVEPWLEAGYDCCIVDIQHPRGKTTKGRLTKVGADIHELYRGHWWLPNDAYAVFMFPDCTYLTGSANRWQPLRGPGCVGRGLMFADACWRLAVEYVGVRGLWMLENPAVGRLSSAWCQPQFRFHPWEYAGYLEDVEEENTSKYTGIWCGDAFAMPPVKPAAPPHRQDCLNMAPSEDRADLRSATPRGFAKAVFLQNCGTQPPRDFQFVEETILSTDNGHTL